MLNIYLEYIDGINDDNIQEFNYMCNLKFINIDKKKIKIHIVSVEFIASMRQHYSFY